MSGWIRALRNGGETPPAVPSTTEEDDTTIFFGQVASHRESADYTRWLQRVAAEEADLEAQQEMMDYLRERMEATGPDAARFATRTLASLGHALDHVSSTVFLPAQYAKVLDSIAWDLCDILLPALWAEWQRACRATQLGNAIQADDQMDVRFRPVSSASLSLLLHLLEQVALHASPREVALSLLAFFEANIQLPGDGFNEDDEEDENASAKAAKDSSALSPYHRLSLAFPLFDLLGQLLNRLNVSPASGSSAPSAATRTALSSRQIELYEQLLSVSNQTLLHVTDQAALVETVGDLERVAWAEMHSKVVSKSLNLLLPTLKPVAPTSNASTAAGIRSSQTLRTSVLSFLYTQLFRTYETFSTAANAVQSLLQGNAFSVPEKDEETPISLLTPRIASILTSILQLSHSLSLCCVTPQELEDYFQRKRTLEEALEKAEMAMWEVENDDDEDAEAEDGNAHDDEYDSADSAENAAVSAAAALDSRRPKSILQELRKQSKTMPSYSVQGVGCYVATVLTYRYFHHIKPERKAAANAEASSTASSTTTTFTIDPSLTSFLSPYSTLGASFVTSLLSLSPSQRISSLGPWLSALLFHATQTGKLDGVVRTITGMVGLWACVPPGSALVPFDVPLEDTGIWTLSEALLQTCFLCPPAWSTAVRPMLMQEWKSLLSSLEPLTRVKLLQLSLSACSVPSIQSLILGRLKNELATAYDAPEGSPEREVLEKMEILAQLHANLTQSEMNLVGSIDFVLALVNVFTFIVLKEKHLMSNAPAADEKTSSRRPPTLGMTHSPVKQVWSEKWSEIADVAKAQMNSIEAELSSMSNDSAATNEVNEKTLLRNQLQLTVELTRRLLEHMQG